MMNTSQKIMLSCMSILLAPSSPTLARWDWKDVAAAGAVAAGVGACVYVATRAEEPHVIRRNTEECYDRIARNNKQITHAYYMHRSGASDDLVHYVKEKGRTYYCSDWFVGDYSPMSDACKQHAPLIRGHAALKAEREELLAFRKQLVEAYGSEHAARYEYYNFDNLTDLINTLHSIAHQIKYTHNFNNAQRKLADYRAHVEEQARKRAELARAEAELAAMHARIEAQRRELRAREQYQRNPYHQIPKNCSLNLTFYN